MPCSQKLVHMWLLIMTRHDLTEDVTTDMPLLEVDLSMQDTACAMVAGSIIPVQLRVCGSLQEV